MGWCYEFGVEIKAGSADPMIPAVDHCYCPQDGAVCRGKFDGCADVWARGPLDVPVAEPMLLTDAGPSEGQASGPRAGDAGQPIDGVGDDEVFDVIGEAVSADSVIEISGESSGVTGAADDPDDDPFAVLAAATPAADDPDDDPFAAIADLIKGDPRILDQEPEPSSSPFAGAMLFADQAAALRGDVQDLAERMRDLTGVVERQARDLEGIQREIGHAAADRETPPGRGEKALQLEALLNVLDQSIDDPAGFGTALERILRRINDLLPELATRTELDEGHQEQIRRLDASVDHLAEAKHVDEVINQSRATLAAVLRLELNLARATADIERLSATQALILGDGGADQAPWSPEQVASEAEAEVARIEAASMAEAERRHGRRLAERAESRAMAVADQREWLRREYDTMAAAAIERTRAAVDGAAPPPAEGRPASAAPEPGSPQIKAAAEAAARARQKAQGEAAAQEAERRARLSGRGDPPEGEDAP